MPFKPPVPLVTSAGRVELTTTEIQLLNAWLDGQRPGRPGWGLADSAAVDVLKRLLGHALGTMSPRPEEPPPAAADHNRDMSTRELAKKRDELLCYLIEHKNGHPGLLGEAAKSLTAVKAELERRLG